MDNVRFVPENDMQEAWEMIGRMHAAMAYIENEKFPSNEIIYAMLGGDIDYLKSVSQGM